MAWASYFLLSILEDLTSTGGEAGKEAVRAAAAGSIFDLLAVSLQNIEKSSLASELGAGARQWASRITR